MSLVGDALRRARSEGGERRGVAIPPGLGPPIRRSLFKGPAAIVLSLAVVAALAALLTWWLLGGSGDTPATTEAGRTINAGTTEGGSMSAHATAATGNEPPTPGTPSTPRFDTSASGGPALSTAAEGDVGAPALPALPSQTGGPSPVQTQGVAEAPALAKSEGAATPVSTPTAARDFVIDAELGYAKLHLDYLVYKPSAPFARINGRDVIVGSIVAGFKVEEIGPDFVRLSDSRGPLTLRVR